jgi:hypothetical protein
MSLIVFLAGILGLSALARGGTRFAFLAVLLPVILLLPADFNTRLPHLPPLSFEDTALFALGVGMLFMDLPRWRFSRMDMWIALFVFSAAYCQRLPWGPSGAILFAMTQTLECLVPYAAGRLLIERPGMRVETIHVVVLVTAVASIIAIPQFVLKWNIFIHFWSHFFPGQFYDFPQVRHGFGRVEGPYGVAESCGMIMLMVLPLAVWLNKIGYAGRPLRYGKIIVAILAFTCLTTQSRGPWMGVIVALAVASIGSARRPLRRAILVFGLGLLVGVPTVYVLGKDYVEADPNDHTVHYGDEAQTAQYRMQMIQEYIPIAQSGGAWGWGSSFPVLQGAYSIDNEFLLIWLTQGYVGAITLILIFVEATIAFAWRGMVARTFQDRYLSFSLLGVLLGLAVCLGTVWLSSQCYMLFFLIIGWSHAVRPGRMRVVEMVPVFT